MQTDPAEVTRIVTLLDYGLSQEFIHVLIEQHCSESNGIAERFVRTLKEWLADKV